jgi:hypothetical protein
VHIGDWLYLIGGTEMFEHIGSEDTSRCMRVNLTTFEWQKIADLNVSRYSNFKKIIYRNCNTDKNLSFYVYLEISWVVLSWVV